jgi:threonine synthase
MQRLREAFSAGFSTEEETAEAISSVWKDFRYLIDTHTAVAYNVLKRYREAYGGQGRFGGGFHRQPV